MVGAEDLLEHQQQPGRLVAAPGRILGLPDALGISAGDRISLNGRPFRGPGSRFPPPKLRIRCHLRHAGGPFTTSDTGLVWLTRAAARGLATSALPLSYILNLRPADAAKAEALATTHSTGTMAVLNLSAWRVISQEDAVLVFNEQRVLLVGSWLLGLLAVASVTVLVGGRMAEQARRVGLLKAVGGTPGVA